MKLRYQPGKRYRAPEEFWDVDDGYVDAYQEHVEYGLAAARRQKLAIVAICRTAMPYLSNTLDLVETLAGRWRDAEMYVYENDSEDDTAAVLDRFALRQWVTVEHGPPAGGEDLRGFQPERTERLAKCRAKCQRWVREHAADASYVMVLDTDPQGGFSVDGVLNSVGWLCQMAGESIHRRLPGAMASFSLLLRQEEGGHGVAQYDAWAARLSTWEDRRDHAWFHLLLPPVGSPPIPMNSAFGGVCVYRREAFLAGEYKGGDCEHVHFHRAMQAAGYQLYLNPGSRYVALLP